MTEAMQEQIDSDLVDMPLTGQDIVKPKRKRATIAKRSKEEKDQADSTCTPLWLAEYLFETHGWFDLDPCSNPRSHIRSRWAYSLEKKLDGLKLPWRGSVFKNNPFSKPLPWQLKANYELSIGRCTELVELCKLDTSTEWWGVITAPIAVHTVYKAGEILDDFDDGEPPRVRQWDTSTTKWYKPDLWLFRDRIQYDESPELIAKRIAEYNAAKARGEKPKGNKNGKSSNNFVSAIIHHRFDLPPLKLEPYADLWRRG